MNIQERREKLDRMRQYLISIGFFRKNKVEAEKEEKNMFTKVISQEDLPKLAWRAVRRFTGRFAGSLVKHRETWERAKSDYDRPVIGKPGSGGGDPRLGD